MKYIEIKQKEKGNLSTIYLYKKGMFFDAFENSAFLLSRFCNLKAVNQPLSKDLTDIVYVGFPLSQKEKYLSMIPSTCTVSDNGDLLLIETPMRLDETDFLSWRTSVRPADKKVSKSHSASNVDSSENTALVLSRLRDFNIITATPDDCQLFLLSLQRLLYSSNKHEKSKSIL